MGFSRQVYWSGLPSPSPPPMLQFSSVQSLSHVQLFATPWTVAYQVPPSMAMATHSTTLAWRTPWMEEPGRLQSMGSLRVRHDWATSLSLFHFNALEKEMATHSSVLAWRIPGRGEPGGLPSMELHRVRQDWNDLAAAAAVVMNILMCYIHSYVACFSQQTTLGCCLAKSAKWLSSVQLSHFGCLN